MSKVPSSLSWHLILALLGAGRHKTKVSIDQATQGQTFQARQITKEKVTKNFAPTRCVTLWGPKSYTTIWSARALHAKFSPKAHPKSLPCMAKSSKLNGLRNTTKLLLGKMKMGPKNHRGNSPDKCIRIRNFLIVYW